ncbi:MAG: PKD domain-containing protein [Myxococcota bacterium]
MMRGWAAVVVVAGLGCGDDGAAMDTDGGSTTGGVGPALTTSGADTQSPGEGSGSTGDAADSTGTPPDPPPNEPPTASFFAQPQSGVAPIDVGFNASMSDDPDGEIVAYDWAFGNGASGVDMLSETNYAEAGCFDVELTVTDDDGATGTATDTIVVVDAVAAGKPDVVLDAQPLPSAVLPRDLETNVGTAHYAGTVNSTGYGFVMAEVLDGQTVVSSTAVALCDAAPVAFELDVPIAAELTAHDVRLSLVIGETQTEFATTTDLVAGDLYMIQGQSNAFASLFNGDANPDNQGPFVRSFGINSVDGGTTAADIAWRMAAGNGAGGPGGVGQWPIRMAAVLAETHQVPVGLLNGSLGGQPIGYFQRDDGDPVNLATNYGRLLTRMRAAGVDGGLRAILWYQGESDGADFQTHHDGFVALYEDWLEDYAGIERTYVTQVRAGCGADLIALQDVQRRFADDYEAISVMSTTALNAHDGCHYGYEDGYKVLGERYAAMLGRDLYGEDPNGDVDPPNPASARFENGGTEVVITMRDEDSMLSFEDGAQADFRLEGAPGVTVLSGVAAGHEVTLTLSGDGSAATGVTYLGRPGAGQWVTNDTGLGLLTFHSIPID